MAGYGERYDYGMRGYPIGEREGPLRRERRTAPRGPRVTARYNREYVTGGRVEDPYPRNYNPYGGDRPGRMVDAGGYRQPYLSIGGTRTYRGAPHPSDYDADRGRYDAGYRRYQGGE